MKCIVCGYENTEAGPKCSFCGKPLVARPVSAAPVASSIVSGAIAAPSATTASVAAPASASAAAAALAPLPLQASSPAAAPVTPPAYLPSAPIFAEQPKKSHKTAFIVAGVCAAILVMTFLAFVGVGLLGYFAQQQQKAAVGRLAHEAVSGQPAAAGSGQQSEMQNLIRDYFRQVRDLNVNYKQQIADLNLSQFPKLYSVESFASADAMRQSQSEVTSIWKVDSDQEDNLRGLREQMRSQVEATSWSDSQKKAFLDGFDTGAGKVIALRDPMVAAEKEWVEAVNDLYQYGLDNASGIEVQNGRVQINDSDIRDSFNQKMHAAQDKYRTMQIMKQSYDQQIAQMMSQTGLNQEDVRGLRGEQ
jgi:hypothetical protein